MEERVRKLEREALAGDPQATEALLWEQRRQGLYVKKHYVLGPPPIQMRASHDYAYSRTRDEAHVTLPYNFELHRVTAYSSGGFWLEISDEMGRWSNCRMYSHSFTNAAYQLLEPRLLPKNSLIILYLENAISQENVIIIEFHGIITETSKQRDVKSPAGY